MNKFDYKKEFMDRIDESESEQFEIIDMIKRTQRVLGIEDTEMYSPNVLLNNKINDLSKEFQAAGVDLFYDPSKSDRPAVVGNAVVGDLVNKQALAISKLQECSNALAEASSKAARKLELQNSNPLSRAFSRIRSMVIPNQDSLLNDKERESIDTVLSEFEDLNNEIYNYNLENNMVDALVKEMTDPTQIGNHVKQHRYTKEESSELLEETVVPDLKKLGLGHLVPQLHESLDRAYGKDSEEKTQEPEKPNKVLESRSNLPSWDLSHWGMSKEQFNEQAAIAPHQDTKTVPVKDIDSFER